MSCERNKTHAYNILQVRFVIKIFAFRKVIFKNKGFNIYVYVLSCLLLFQYNVESIYLFTCLYTSRTATVSILRIFYQTEKHISKRVLVDYTHQMVSSIFRRLV